MLLRIFVDWSWTPLAGYALTLIFVLVLPLLLYELWVEKQGSLLALTHGSWIWRCAVYLLAIFALVFFSPQRPSEFIYFQF